MSLQLSAYDISYESLTLSWTHLREVDSYRILHRQAGKLVFKWVDIKSQFQKTLIKDLLDGSKYEFKVQAISNSKHSIIESDIYPCETKEFHYDILMIGKTGQGKSTLGNKLLNIEKSIASNIDVFASYDSEASASEDTEKRFLQGNDPGAVRGESVTKMCKLMASRDINVRVLDVPGFSDSHALKETNRSVTEGNLQIIRWVVRAQIRSKLKVRRIAYFLPVRGPLEVADGILQEELRLMYHYFGKELFECMVVIATNQSGKKYQEIRFDDDDYENTKEVFQKALNHAVTEEIICPPIVYLGANDSPSDCLSNIKDAKVLKETIFSLQVRDDTCSRCSVKTISSKEKQHLSVMYSDGITGVYADSKCHPAFVPKYSTAEKIVGGLGHVATLGFSLLADKSWPGFTNSDEICLVCKTHPGAVEGCTKVKTNVPCKDKTITVDHSHKIY